MDKKWLIDANFLDDRCRHQMADEWNKKVAPVSWSEAYKEFLDDVWDAPTVDAVEVVHGKWEIFDDGYGCELMYCSVCKSEFYDGDNDTVDHLHNYCPNCGAKMDGDGNG